MLVSAGSARGFAFYACPDVRGTLPAGPDADHQAAKAALRFVLGRREVADPTVRFNVPGWSRGEGDEAVLETRSARKDGLVSRACGERVSARSWRVTVDDGSASASLDVWLYLVRRVGGWKVWAAY